MTCAIRTENLSKKYKDLAALTDLNLNVPEGSIYALTGPNGAGKTTTIDILMNLVRASSGRAEVLGIESSSLSRQEFTSIGYVSENQEMPGWMTVEYLFEYLRPFYPSWDGDLVRELQLQFDLPPRAKLCQLSRGMRIKAALTSSLAYHPKLIVLDEPFTGLDAKVREQLIEGLLEQAAGTTVLISSHDLVEVESFASHVGYLANGRLCFSEEMSSLAERFREVEVICEAPPVLPSEWPEAWMCPHTSAAVLRFVESRFDSEKTAAEVHRHFPDARNVSFIPMSLRAIFLAFAKTPNKAA